MDISVVDKLVELPIAEWPKLRDLYRRDWPKHFLGFLTVDTFVRWTTQRHGPIKNLNIYTLNGDWSDDGTFVCTFRYQLFVNTLNPCIDRLTQAVALLDWATSGYKASTVLRRHRPAVDEIIKSLQLTKESDSETLLYYIPHTEAAELDIVCPPGITLAPLSVDHADRIDAVWPNRHEGSLFFMREILDLSPSVGAFDDNGQLVAWCLRLPAGTHGVLQVEESHMQRGLGTLVVKALAKKLAEMGLDSCVCVHDDNVASNRVMVNAGFRVVDKAYYIRTYPTEPFTWVDEQQDQDLWKVGQSSEEEIH